MILIISWVCWIDLKNDYYQELQHVYMSSIHSFSFCELNADWFWEIPESEPLTCIIKLMPKSSYENTPSRVLLRHAQGKKNP